MFDITYIVHQDLFFRILDKRPKKEVGRLLATVPDALVEGTLEGVGDVRPSSLLPLGKAKLTCGRSERIVSFERGLRKGVSKPWFGLLAVASSNGLVPFDRDVLGGILLPSSITLMAGKAKGRCALLDVRVFVEMLR